MTPREYAIASRVTGMNIPDLLALIRKLDDPDNDIVLRKAAEMASLGEWGLYDINSIAAIIRQYNDEGTAEPISASKPAQSTAKRKASSGKRSRK